MNNAAYRSKIYINVTFVMYCHQCTSICARFGLFRMNAISPLPMMTEPYCPATKPWQQNGRRQKQELLISSVKTLISLGHI